MSNLKTPLLGDNIKNIRKSRNISAKAFAKKINIPYSTYSNYENNNRVPNISTLEIIAEGLDVNIMTLLGICPKFEHNIYDNPSLFYNFIKALPHDTSEHVEDSKVLASNLITHINEFNEWEAVLKFLLSQGYELKFDIFYEDGIPMTFLRNNNTQYKIKCDDLTSFKNNIISYAKYQLNDFKNKFINNIPPTTD